MNRVLKVFATTKDEQDELAKETDVLERYDAFVLVDAPEAQAARLERTHLVEDITDLYEIELGTGTVDTSKPRVDAEGATRPHPAYRRSPKLSPGPHHYLVQFAGPIKDTWLRGVKRAGGEPRQLWANFTFVIDADDAAIARIAALPYVRWTGHLPYTERLSEAVRKELAGDDVERLPRTRLLPCVYTVEFFGGKDIAPALPAVRKTGVRVLDSDPKGKIVVVETSHRKAERQKQLRDLSAVHAVRKIRQRPVRRPSNDIAAQILGTAACAAAPLGLSGKGETIGICDTGLDTGDPKTIHPDFTGRVASIKSYPMTPDFNRFVTNPNGDDGPADLDSGHGTHTSGSILGSGAASSSIAGQAAPIRGLAHDAQLVFQAVEQECKWKDPADLKRNGRYLLAGIPADLKKLFGDAYTKGARIHSNSWGGGDAGAYDEQCRAVDQYVWDHKDFCIVVAAGNDGTDRDGDGRINPMSVTPPATAKNCITVGACENNRTNFNKETYGEWWPDDFPAAPFHSDPMANNPDQLVAFSSRGPTKDKRNKPDVVAPGTFVLSTRSTMIAPNNMAWAAFPKSRMYFYMGGTSMATPLVSGAVALVRQYLRSAQNIADPSAALLKASLIAGAVRLPGGSSGALVDSQQGYGRVDLDNVIAPQSPASSRFVEGTPGLRTGQLRSTKLAVKSSRSQLRIVLVWSDAPGPTLVNNLNLIVTAPDGTKHVGNQSSSGRATLDLANNVEVVQIAKPAAGDWTIDVVGSNVARGPQDYALVAIGHF